MAFKRFDGKVTVRELQVPPLKVQDIPTTAFVKKVAPPVKPTQIIEEPESPLEDDIPIPTGYEDVQIEIGKLPQPPEEPRVPIWVVEIQPQLIGGPNVIAEYINKHNLYPRLAKDTGISGSALIGFVVDKEGYPQDVHVIQEKPEGFGFGSTGVTVIKAMKFTPGVQRDIHVAVEMKQLINFHTE